MTSLKLVVDTPLRWLTVTVSINPTVFCTTVRRCQPEINMQQTTLCSRMSYVLDADSGRYADALTSYENVLTVQYVLAVLVLVSV